MNQKYALTRPDDRWNKESPRMHTGNSIFETERQTNTKGQRGGRERDRQGEWYIMRERELCRNLILLSGWRVEKLSPLSPLLARTPYAIHTASPLRHRSPPPSGARLSPLRDVAPSLSMTCVSMNEPAVGISARIRAYASTKRTRIPCGCTTASLCAWRSRSAPLPLWLSQASFLFSFIFFFFFNTNVYLFSYNSLFFFSSR